MVESLVATMTRNKKSVKGREKKKGRKKQERLQTFHAGDQ